MHHVFQRFIDGITTSVDAGDLKMVLAEAAGALELSCFAYLLLPYRRGDEPRLISTYPVRWTDHYLRRRYERFDPVIVEALARSEPFEWGSDFPRNRCQARRIAFLRRRRSSGSVVASRFQSTIRADRSRR